MKLDVTQVLTGYDGEIIHEADDDGKVTDKATTLRIACARALMGHIQGEDIKGEEKLRRFTLARRIYKEDVVSLTVEEAALIKSLVGRFYVTNVVGAVWELLEAATEKEQEPAPN
jgi:hypothetical protein